MTDFELTIEQNYQRGTLLIETTLNPPTINCVICHEPKIYQGRDLFDCFNLLREDNPHIKFMCKGSKLNVHPSRMSSQMSSGMMAYELTLGKQAFKEDMVNIFDYDDTEIVKKFSQQKDFFLRWIKSLGRSD